MLQYNRLFMILIPAVLLSSLIRCSQTETTRSPYLFAENSPIMRVFESDSIMFQWNVPDECESDIDKYVVSYKIINKNSSWEVLDTLDVKFGNMIKIKRDQLPASENLFEIAVRNIAIGGDTSELAKSTEAESNSDGGWYLFWKLY